MIELFLETLNDANCDLTIRENHDEMIFEMIFNYVQDEIEFHYLFRVNRDLNKRSQINLFFVHHYKKHARRRENDRYCWNVDLIVDVDLIREYD